ELVATGVPKDRIVLAFHPPEIREHTGYAIA
ncbi:element excision factor XisI family protein, partial [Moorena sp. SIO2C4]